MAVPSDAEKSETGAGTEGWRPPGRVGADNADPPQLDRCLLPEMRLKPCS